MLDPAELDYFKWRIPGGQRVRLALYEAQDLATMHHWKHQVDISFLTCRAVQRMSLEERQRRFQEHVPSVFALRRLSDDRFMGEISVYGYNAKNRSIGVGYFTGPDYRQQGYTQEGLRLMLRFLFETVNLNKVTADTGAFNASSVALLRACGFQQDGRLRQHQLLNGVLHDRLLFSLLAEDWQTQRVIPSG
ncbi:MAG: GNAT family protein [Cyanobacteria bacterium J06598_1]